MTRVPKKQNAKRKSGQRTAPGIPEPFASHFAKLSCQDQNVRAVIVQGRDLLSEIARLTAERDGWAKIAVEAQLKGAKR